MDDRIWRMDAEGKIRWVCPECMRILNRASYLRRKCRPDHTDEDLDRKALAMLQKEGFR